MTIPTLLEVATTLPPSWFAVVDGAAFDNLPATLRASQLTGVPLYLEAGNEDGVRAGPYLVALPSRTELATLTTLVAADPAAVIWSWPGDFASLRRHLRGLNLAEIPNERRTGPGDAAYETVLFRHWDPNVLAVTLPVLTEAQRGRFLGNAEGLAYDATDYAGVTLAPRPEGLPAKARGMLRFEVAQIEGIKVSRVRESHGRIAKYLRETAPQQTNRLSQFEIRAAISEYETQAHMFGLFAERDIAQWSFIQIMSGNNFHRE